jgi:hypothetical protein
MHTANLIKRVSRIENTNEYFKKKIRVLQFVKQFVFIRGRNCGVFFSHE